MNRKTNPLQAIIDADAAERAAERARTQMTLGEAIAALESLPGDMPVDGLQALGSYRGYYRDLAFGSEGERTLDHRGLYEDWDERTLEAIPDSMAPEEAVIQPGEIKTVDDLLADCRSALGACFMGYKGGDFWMTAATPLWVSPYGSASGLKLMAFDTVDGVLTPVTQQEEW